MQDAQRGRKPLAVDPQQSSGVFLRVWWTDVRVRLLVLLMTSLGVIDGVFTSFWIESHGIHEEMNPFARWLFGSELRIVWLLVNVAISFLSGVILASSCQVLEGNERRFVAWFFSLLLAVKTTLAGLHAIYYIDIEALAPAVLVLSVIVLFYSRNILLGGNIVLDIVHVFSNLWTDVLWTLSAACSVVASIRTDAVDLGSDARLDKPIIDRKHRGERLAFWIAVIVTAPIVALSVMEMIVHLSGAQSLPRWLRGLGIVTAVQGQLVLVSLGIVILTMVIMLYAFLTVFEILSDTREKQRSQ